MIDDDIKKSIKPPSLRCRHQTIYLLTQFSVLFDVAAPTITACSVVQSFWQIVEIELGLSSVNTCKSSNNNPGCFPPTPTDRTDLHTHTHTQRAEPIATHGFHPSDWPQWKCDYWHHYELYIYIYRRMVFTVGLFFYPTLLPSRIIAPFSVCPRTAWGQLSRGHRPPPPGQEAISTCIHCIHSCLYDIH